jgi:BirA family transcriptional regulator, biotin operon repressor / biotin---[acetyl-CoA-carboxylase] ligase
MKEKILHLLRSETAPVSGETVSSCLGISRVSIWKHIRTLQTMGYDIEAGPKGYRLISTPDIPYPWELPGRSHLIHHFIEIGSTMEKARELARGGAPAMTVVVAERQVKGRGRLDRTWQSEAGGLYFTVVLRPDVSPILSARVNLCAATVLTQSIRRAFGIDARLKWPNDVLVEDQKLCGMLLEMEAEGDRVSFINVGIGINVNNQPEKAVPTATSIFSLLGRPVSRTQLLADFLDSLENALNGPLDESIISQWKANAITLNRPVKIVTTKETLTGRAVDMDDTGALILEKADGTRIKITYGDCFHTGGPNSISPTEP